MKKYLAFLIMAILLGATMRTFMLASRPDGFTWDEAALGYNSYSLLKTGKDEYGKVLPIILKSFGDYKPGLYTYFLVPLTGFGLNPFTTRLPSAIFGTLGILVVFLLARDLFDNRVGLAAGVLMAINPWSIQFSRGAWEANINFVLTMLATLLFLRKKYFWAVVFFGLTFWMYQGAKLFTPLLLASLILIYRSQIKFSSLIKQGLIILVFILPIVFGLNSQSGRLKVYNVFSYHRAPNDVQEILQQDGSAGSSIYYYLFHSEMLDQLRGVYTRYLNHFSPKFLFITGDWTSLRQTVSYYGYFHVVEILTIGLGLVWAIKNPNKHTKLLVAWLILAAIPASLSRDQVSGIRSLPMLMPLLTFSAIGLTAIWQRKYLRIGFVAALAFLAVYYGDLYLVHARYFSAPDWLSAYRPAVDLVGQNEANYQRIVFSQKLGQPYIFVLYYLKIDPRVYQAQSHLTENSQGDVGTVDKFGKYEFRDVYWREDRKMTSTLFVGTQLELPDQDLDTVPNLVHMGDINYPNSKVALRIVGIP